ncbi:hypothetical protein [Streptomyces sp. XH2]|uniref:hypothetical protein n=1 Tax=Streptomyces sp. XH2 TaxID=3412483 RepID=UPI003C7B0345
MIVEPWTAPRDLVGLTPRGFRQVPVAAHSPARPRRTELQRVFTQRIIHLRSYRGACTGAFRQGATVHVTGRLVHIQAPGQRKGFGIELTPCRRRRVLLGQPGPLIHALTDRLALDCTQCALGLGCGPGTVAVEPAGLIDPLHCAPPAPVNDHASSR